MDELSTALDAGLPVFVTECGLSEASGDGTVDFESAARWFGYVNEKKLSYAVWSFSNKNESSAMFRPGYDPKKPVYGRGPDADGALGAAAPGRNRSG